MATIRDWTSVALIGMLFLAIMLAAMLSGGCAYTKATTEVYVDPVRKIVRFIDTKDNELSLESVTYTETPDGACEFKLTGLNILNEASPVAIANVQQMLAFAEQQRAANEGIASTLIGISDVVSSLGYGMTYVMKALAAIIEALPGVEFDLETPWGSGRIDVEDRAPPGTEDRAPPGTEGDTGSNGVAGGGP